MSDDELAYHQAHRHSVREAYKTGIRMHVFLVYANLDAELTVSVYHYLKQTDYLVGICSLNKLTGQEIVNNEVISILMLVCHWEACHPNIYYQPSIHKASSK